MDLSRRLRELRQARGLSQLQLAALVDTSNVVISRYESGVRRPDADMLAKLAAALGTSVDYLLGRTDDPAPPGGKPKPAGQPTDQEFRAFLRGRKLSERDIELILQLEERMRRENEEKKKGQE